MISPEGLAIRPRIPASWLHLRRRTARARVAHHVDRVDRLRRPSSALSSVARHFVHHGVRRPGRRPTAPGVDHLVVLFLLGDEAVLVLLLVVLATSALVSLISLSLRVRDDHVVLAERDAGLERVAEAERHDRDRRTAPCPSGRCGDRPGR